MNNGLKRILSIVLSVAMLVSSVTVLNTVSVAAADNTYIMEESGWYESAYVTWTTVPNATGFAAYVKGANEPDSAYVQLDNELIRKYPTYFRADAVGLKAGQYVLKVVPYINGGLDESKAFVTGTLDVKAYDRSGFAFSSNSPFKTASGAYNDDGTLKSNAKVFYVTKDTAKTISTDVVISEKGTTATYTGLQAIITAKQKGYDTTPFDFRIIGTIEAEDMDGFDSSAEGLQVKGNDGYSEMNITIEGIGEDAGIRNFGILIRNAVNVELRNFAVMLCMEDSISLDTKNANIWIHNLDLFYGQKGSAADQIKGDGTIDLKDDSQYVTISYNHLYDCGKASLCGMKDETGPNYITYHHNWFDHSDSRHPRIRTMSVHVYNNYYDGIAKYGIGASSNSSAFVESNYFVDCKYPTLQGAMAHDSDGNGGSNTFTDSTPTGVIKFYNNKLTGTYQFTPDNKNTISNPAGDAYVVETRDEVVPSTYKTTLGATYSNFDTNSSIDLGVDLADITPVDDVPSVVMANAGRMNGGDFFETTGTSRSDYIGLTSSTYDASDHVLDDVLKAAITNYTPTLVSVGGLTTGGTVDTTVSVSTTTTTESTTETTTEAPTETTTVSTPVEIGEAQTGFTSDSDNDTGSGVSVTYNAANNTWALTDTSATAAAELTIPFAEQTSGKVVISGTVQPSTTASKWAFVQIRGTKADGTSSEIIGFGGGADKSELSVRVNGASTYTKIGSLAAKNYEYTVIVDLDNKTAEVTIDGITNTYNVDVASISSLYSTTSKTASRNVTVAVPYVGVLGEYVPPLTTEATTEVTTAATTEATTVATTEATSEATTEVIPPEPGILYGDVDRNGTRDITDVALLIHQIRNGNVEPVSGINDVTMDGKVDTADVATILQKILDASFIMPCETGDVEPSTDATTEVTTENTTEATTTAPDVDETEETTTVATTEATTEATTAAPIGGSLDQFLTDTVKWDIGSYSANSDLKNGLKVLLDVAPVTDVAKAFTAADGSTYEYSKAAEDNNAMSSSTNGDVLSFTAPADGVFTIAFKVSSGKIGSVFGESIDATNASAYCFRQYPVIAGQTYTAGVAGSKLRVFYLGYTPNITIDPDPVVTTVEMTTEATTQATTEKNTVATTTVVIDDTTETTTAAADSEGFYSFNDNPAVTKDGTSGITYTVSTKEETTSDNLTAIASVVNGALFLNDASATDTVKATLPLPEKTSGTVTYTAKITPSTASTNWTIMQLNGLLADGETEGEVLGIRTDGNKNYGIRVNAGSAVTSTTATSAANTEATVVITVDFDNDTATLSVNGSAPVTVTGVDANSITSMSFQTATGARNLTVDDAGIITGDVDEPSSEPTTGEEPTVTPITPEPVPEGAVVHNFTTDGTDSLFFTIVGNLATDKGAITYNGLNLTQCLKMETATSIKFTAASAGTLTLVFNAADTKHNCKVDGTKLDSDANGVVTVELAAGEHEITKRDSSNLYYMSFVS